MKAFLEANIDLVPTQAVCSIILRVRTFKEHQQFMNEKVYTSVGLLMFCIQRCIQIGLKLNLITDEDFEKALEKAQWCDQKRQELGYSSQTLSLIFGIPISIKDNLLMERCRCTVGCARLVNNVIPEGGDSWLLKALRKEGAIPFVKSNVPQLMMTIESVNNIFGRAINPYCKERTTGGSSGGEAGLVASYCSVAGFGTDIGGSLRNPAAFCGLYSYKTSSWRVASARADAGSGLSLIRGVAGPLCRSLEDTNFLQSKMIDWCNADVDPWKYIPIPICQEKYEQTKAKEKLKVGYLVESLITTSNACKSPLLKTIDALKKEGHEVIEMPKSLVRDSAAIFMNLLFSTNSILG